jgi:hypothetical protein
MTLILMTRSRSLHVLPEEYHAQFRSEYAAAADGARRPEPFHQLQEMLRLWQLLAVAHSSPGYAGRLAAALRDTRQTSSRPES